MCKRERQVIIEGGFRNSIGGRDWKGGRNGNDGGRNETFNSERFKSIKGDFSDRGNEGNF